MTLEQLASTSKSSLSGAVGMTQAMEGAAMLGCITVAVLMLFRGAMW